MPPIECQIWQKDDAGLVDVLQSMACALTTYVVRVALRPYILSVNVYGTWSWASASCTCPRHHCAHVACQFCACVSQAANPACCVIVP